MANKTGDSGIVTTPTTRLSVFAGGMPASTSTADFGTATNTILRPDCFNPSPVLFVNPPEAPSDPGSA